MRPIIVTVIILISNPADLLVARCSVGAELNSTGGASSLGRPSTRRRVRVYVCVSQSWLVFPQQERKTPCVFSIYAEAPGRPRQ
jgi:hypothetical protein